MQVNGIEAESIVPTNATSVSLRIELPAGPAKMETWLTDEAAGRSRGAFFVEARRLD
jgi:uncharacterized sulfatase